MNGHGHQLLLSTSEVGDLLGVHPSTVKRWAQQDLLTYSRTRGGHRRFRLREVLEGAREQGIRTFLDRFHPWEANVWLALSAAGAGGDFSKLINLALSWLRQGDTDLLGHLFFEVAERGEIPFPTFLDHAVRGFMARVGEEWQAGRLQVGEEHMATEVIQEAFLRMRMARESSPDSHSTRREHPPVAVVGAAEGDQHDLGARSIRAVLERNGWRVYFLGGNVPVEDFARIQQAQVADLVCISFPAFSTLPDLQRAMETLGRYYNVRSPYALAIGGTFAGFPPEDLPGHPFNAFTVSDSAEHFQRWLQDHFPSSSNENTRRIA